MSLGGDYDFAGMAACLDVFASRLPNRKALRRVAGEEFGWRNIAEKLIDILDAMDIGG